MLRKLKRILLALCVLFAAAAVVILSVSNNTPVTLSLFPLPYTLETPLFFFGFSAFCSGLLIGAGLFSYASLRLRGMLARERKRTAALENELAGLRAESVGMSHVQHITRKAS